MLIRLFSLSVLRLCCRFPFFRSLRGVSLLLVFASAAALVSLNDSDDRPFRSLVYVQQTINDAYLAGSRQPFASPTPALRSALQTCICSSCGYTPPFVHRVFRFRRCLPLSNRGGPAMRSITPTPSATVNRSGSGHSRSSAGSGGIWREWDEWEGGVAKESVALGG